MFDLVLALLLVLRHLMTFLYRFRGLSLFYVPYKLHITR